jgi:hypothetical protein
VGEAGRSVGLVLVGGDDGGVAGTAGKRRGRGGSTAQRRATAGPAAESTGGGRIVRRRRGGKMEGVGGIFSRCVFARVRRDAVRYSRRVTFGAPDSAKCHAPQKFAAPAWIARLLEGRFRLSVLYIDGLFSACIL